MKPALSLYPHISSYPVLMLLGFFFGWLLARRRAALFGIEPRHLDNLALILPIAGIFGARFFARLFYADLSLWQALKIWEGDGLVFYGGFIFGATAVLAYGLTRRLRLIGLLDCVAPSVALGLAFGRIGCFMAGCCWGDVCLPADQLTHLNQPTAAQVQTIPALSTPAWPLAVQFPQKSAVFRQHLKHGLVAESATTSAPVHPVQLYESAFAFLLCFLLYRVGRPLRPGNISLALLFGYAVIRFATEFLRADNTPGLWGLTFSQHVSLGILFFATLALLLRPLIAKYWAPAATAPYKSRPAIG